MSKIFALGNSHILAFVGAKPGDSNDRRGRFIARSLGGTIAYNFFEHHYPRLLEILETEKEFDKARDYVLLVVGEVDCRLHLVNQIKLHPERSEKAIISECVERFFRCHQDLKARGYKVIGWGSHPSRVAEHLYVIGPYDKRLHIGRYFERSLKWRCEKEGILFKSIFNKLLLPSGLLREELYYDYCHLNPDKVTGLIEEEFNDLP